jgi:hypothetical protein
VALKYKRQESACASRNVRVYNQDENWRNLRFQFARKNNPVEAL